MFIFAVPILWIVVCTVFIAYEIGWGAFVCTAVAAVLAHFFLGFSIFGLAMASPMLFAKWGAAYVGAGLVWASFKFFIKLRKARSSYVKDKKAWLKEIDVFRQGVTAEVTQRTEADWIGKIRRTNTENYAPTVGMNKERIMFWAWWWPFSMVNFLLEDLIRELWNASWRAIRTVMEGVRKVALGEAAKDLD
jgi:hypothetical protein